MGEQALCCEIVASSYVYQPNYSYAGFMFSLHSDLTQVCYCGCRCAAQCLVRATPPREHPTGLFINLWPHSFHKIIYVYSICLVSTTCCDATITKYKRNTNIQELRTLLNALLIVVPLGLYSNTSRIYPAVDDSPISNGEV